MHSDNTSLLLQHFDACPETVQEHKHVQALPTDIVTACFLAYDSPENYLINCMFTKFTEQLFSGRCVVMHR